MAVNITNFGFINYKDNHREYNIHTTGNNIADIIRQCDAEDVQAEEAPSSIPPDFFCISQKFSEQNIRERLDAELAQATSKIDYCRALYSLQHIGCININQYASDAKRAIVFNDFQSKYNLTPDDFCRARMKK